MKISDCKTFGELFEVAQKHIESLGTPTIQICGPMTTGGKGSQEKNLIHLRKNIANYIGLGYAIFDQTLYFEQQIKISEDLKKNKYPNDILENFFEPLFSKGLLEECWFLPDRESSTGAKREMNQTKKNNISVKFL